MIAEAIVIGIVVGVAVMVQRQFRPELDQQAPIIPLHKRRERESEQRFKSHVLDRSIEFQQKYSHAFVRPSTRNDAGKFAFYPFQHGDEYLGILDDLYLWHSAKILEIERLYGKYKFEEAFIGFYRQWSFVNMLLSEDAEQRILENIKSKRLLETDQYYEFNSDQIYPDDFTARGWDFSQMFYRSYLAAFEYEFIDYESVYLVKNNLKNYTRIKKILDRRYKIWKKYQES